MNERIKELRKVLSITMEDFGERLGVTRSAISNIESGKRGVTDQMVMAICRAFDVSENWLRNGDGKMFIPVPKNELEKLSKRYNLNRLEFTILEKYLNLSDEERKAVYDFITDIFSDFNETRAPLDAPAEVVPDPHYPDAMFRDSPPVASTIDEKVEAYRRELELEAKAGEKSEALREDA